MRSALGCHTICSRAPITPPCTGRRPDHSESRSRMLLWPDAASSRPRGDRVAGSPARNALISMRHADLLGLDSISPYALDGETVPSSDAALSTPEPRHGLAPGRPSIDEGQPSGSQPDSPEVRSLRFQLPSEDVDVVDQDRQIS